MKMRDPGILVRAGAAGVLSILAALSSSAGGITSTYTYDQAGRLISVTLSDGTQIIYTLDAAGNRTAVVTTLDTTAPTVPTGVNGNVSTSPFQIALSWTASVDTGSGVGGYDVFRNGTQIGTSTSTAYTDTTMACTTQYNYTVAAYDNAVPPNVSAQSSPWSTTTPSIAPTVPTGLAKVSATSTQVVLSWSASTDYCMTLTGYKIYRGGTQIGTSTTTGYTDSTVSGTTTYSYTVASYDSANTSAQSSPLSVTTPDTIPPSVPTGLTASDVNAVQINLAWNASTDTGGSGLAGYKIYRGGTLIGTSSTNSYSDTTCSANTTYTYTVAAYDNAGNVSAQSSGASATTNNIPSVPPGQPGPHGMVRSSPWTESWTASSGPVSYYNFNNNGTNTKVNAPTVSIQMSGGNGDSYTVKVQACNSSNQCSAFGTASVVTYCANGTCP